MEINWQKKAEHKRMRRNKEIAEEIKSGEFIPTPINREMSWFPPRPIIKKDVREMNRLTRTIYAVEGD